MIILEIRNQIPEQTKINTTRAFYYRLTYCAAAFGHHFKQLIR